jgi:hypothetical protein
MNNEVQQLKDTYNNARHSATKWTSCFGALASVRSQLNKEVSGAYADHYDAEQTEVLQSALKRLNSLAGYANKKREEANAEADAASNALFPPTIEDAELLDLGARMSANPQAISTNIEGSAYLAHQNKLKHEVVNRDGCCGGNPDSDGFCYGFGMCPRHKETKSAVTFCTNYVNWLDESNEQAGLADVAARLSDGFVISSEATNV